MKHCILNVLVIILFSSKNVAGQEGIDCLGKAFHCVNSTHFLICVDFGHEVSMTVDNFAIPCPASTACRHQNKFECELEPTKSDTLMNSTTKNTASAKNPPTLQNTERQWEAAVTNTDAIVLQFDNATSRTVAVEKEALTEIINSSTTPPRRAKPALIFSSENAAITNISQTSTYSPNNMSYSMYDSAVIALERTTPASSVPLNQSSNTSDGVNSITKNTTANDTTLPTIPKAIETEQPFTTDSVYNLNGSEFKLISLVPPSTGNYVSSESENLKVTNKQTHDSSTSPDATSSYGIEIFTMTNPPSVQYIPQKSRTMHGVVENGLYNTLKPSILTTAASKSTDQIFANIIPESSANQVTTSSSEISTEPSNLQHSSQDGRITPLVIETQHYSTLKQNVSATETLQSMNQIFINIIPESSANQVTMSSSAIEISTTEPSTLQHSTEEGRIASVVIETQNYNTLKTNVSSAETLQSKNQTFVNIIPESSANQVTTSSSEITTTQPSNLQHSTQEGRITPVVIETQNYSTLKQNGSTAEILQSKNQTFVNNQLITSSGIEISTTEQSTLQHSTKNVNSHELSEKILTTSINGIEISSINQSTGHYITQEVNIIPAATGAQNDSTLKPNVSSTITATSMNKTPVYVKPELLVNEVQTSYTEIKISTMDLPPLQHVTQESRITPKYRNVMEIQVYNNSKPNDFMIAASTLTDLISVNLTSELSVNQVTTSSSANEFSTINTSTLQHSTPEVSITPVVIETHHFTTLKSNVSTTETLQSINHTLFNIMPESLANHVTTSSGIEISTTEPSTLQHSTKQVISHELPAKANTLTTSTNGIEISTINPSTVYYITQKESISPAATEAQNYSTLKINVSTTTTATAMNETSVNMTPELLANGVQTSYSEIKKPKTDQPPLQHVNQESSITHGIIEMKDYNNSKANVSMTAASTLTDQKFEVTTSFSAIAISTNESSTLQHSTQEVRITPVVIETQNYSTLKPNVKTTETLQPMNQTFVNIIPESSANQVKTSSENEISTTEPSILQHSAKQVISYELTEKILTKSTNGIKISTINPSTAHYITQEVRHTPAASEAQNDSNLNSNVSNSTTATATNEISVNITHELSANGVHTSYSEIKIPTMDLPALQQVNEESNITQGIIEIKDYNNSKVNVSMTAASTLTDVKSVNMTSALSANEVTTSFSALSISMTDPSTLQHSTQEVRITPVVIETQNDSTLKPNVSTTETLQPMNQTFVNVKPESSANQVKTSSGFEISTTQPSTSQHSTKQAISYELSEKILTTSTNGIEISTINPSTEHYITQEGNITPAAFEAQNDSTLKPNVSATTTAKAMNEISVNITPELSANGVKTNYSEINISTMDPLALQQVNEESSTQGVIEMKDYNNSKANESMTAASTLTDLKSINMTSALSANEVTTSFSAISISALQHSTQEVRITPAVIETLNYSTPKPNVSTTETLQPKNQTFVNIIPESSANQVKASSRIEISTTEPSTLQHSTKQVISHEFSEKANTLTKITNGIETSTINPSSAHYITQKVRITSAATESQNDRNLKLNFSTTTTATAINETSVNMTPELLANGVQTSYSEIKIPKTDQPPLQHVTQESKIDVVIEIEDYNNSKPMTAKSKFTDLKSVNITPELSANQLTTSFSGTKISTTDPSSLHHSINEVREYIFETQNSTPSKPNVSTTAAVISKNLTPVNINYKLSASQEAIISGGIEISTTNPSTAQYITQQVTILPAIIETQNYSTLKPNISTTAASISTNHKSMNIISELLENKVTTSYNGNKFSATNTTPLQYVTQESRTTPEVIEKEYHYNSKQNYSMTVLSTPMNQTLVNIISESSANEVAMSSNRIEISTTDRSLKNPENIITHEVIETHNYITVKANVSKSLKDTNRESIPVSSEWSANQETTSPSTIERFPAVQSHLQYSTQESRTPQGIIKIKNYITSKPKVSITATSPHTIQKSVNMAIEWSANQVARSSSGIEVSSMNPSTLQYSTQEVRVPTVIQTYNYSTPKLNVSTIAASISRNQKSINITSKSLENQEIMNSFGIKISATDLPPSQYVTQESRTANRVIETDYYKNHDSKPNESMTASITTNQIFFNVIPESPANQVSMTSRGITIYTTDPSPLPHITQEVSIKPPVVAVTQDYRARKTNLSSTATSTSTNQTVANITSQVSANQASSGGLEMATEDPYQLQYLSQEPKITSAVIETQNYNTLIPNFSTTAAWISFKPTTAHITSKRPVKQAKQIVPNHTIESKFDFKQTNNFSNFPPIDLGVSSVNYDSEYIYNNTENKSAIENSQAKSSFHLPKSTSVYLDQSTVYKTKTSNNLPKPQPSKTEISKTTIVTPLFPPQGNFHTKNNGISIIEQTEISSVTQTTHVSSVLNNSTSIINNQVSGNHISSDTSATITTVTGRTSAIPSVKRSYDSSLMGKSSTTPNGLVVSMQSEQIIPTISSYNITNIFNESLKTNFTPTNLKQLILNKTSVSTTIFREPSEKLISLNPKVITNVFPETTTINPNMEQIERSVTTISSDHILNEHGHFLFNVKKQQSLPNSKDVVSTTSFGENQIEIKSTAASVTDNYNAITSSMDAFMNVEIDTISRVVSPESTIHGISIISEKLTKVDKLPEISTQYLLGLTSPLVPSQSKTTQDIVKNVLESTSEVGQVSTKAMENENNLQIHNLNIKYKNSEMKEQEVLGGRNFTCNGKNIGRYADLRNPKKFYICVGMSNPIVGFCPQDAIYLILQNKCYKNATICEQFHCLKGGRFADPCSRDSYFICHANSSGALVRYKLQCQRGYYVSSSVKCSPVRETTQILINTTIGPKAQSKKINETVVANICSGNNIYNASTNKCNTINNSCAQFHCSHIGRFKDPCSSNSYYICQQNSSGALVRYKLQCQPGYGVNSRSIKCTPLPQMTITNYSKIEAIVTSETKINKSSEEKVDNVRNKKNIDNNATNKFKDKILKEVMDRTKYKDVETYLTTNKQIEQKIKDNERRDNFKLAKIVKVKIEKDKYNSKESSEEKFDKNIKKKQMKREIQVDSSQSVENDKFTCDTEGNYPYPQDCRKYYECTYNKKRGKFRRRLKNCKNNELFNGNVSKCVFNKN